jgi:hypothetical protein
MRQTGRWLIKKGQTRHAQGIGEVHHPSVDGNNQPTADHQVA